MARQRERRDGTALVARRIGPLDGRYHRAAGVTLAPIEPRRRISLRAAAEAVAEAGKALGFKLPDSPKTSGSRKGVAALWLGPDEWLVIAGEAGSEGLAEKLGGIAGASAVDVSHRSAAIAVEGAAAEAVIAAGCPQDIRLRSFPVGASSRTVLSKTEIVLWRTGETRFEIECWRSFSDYAWLHLVEASRAPAA